MSVFRQVVKKFLTACVPRRRFLVSGPNTGHDSLQLALTFDDGPHPDHTPVLLDRLKQYGLVGTFFVVGELAEKYPEIVRRICEEGHEIGNHTWSHGEPSKTSAGDFLDEVQRTDALIKSLTGRPTTLMRPPKGQVTWRKLLGLWKLGKTVALWSVDPRDYQMSEDAEVNQWCATFVPGNGDILLFHDNHPWAAKAVEQLALKGTFEKFRNVTVSTLTVASKSQNGSSSLCNSGISASQA